MDFRTAFEIKPLLLPSRKTPNLPVYKSISILATLRVPWYDLAMLRDQLVLNMFMYSCASESVT